MHNITQPLKLLVTLVNSGLDC